MAEQRYFEDGKGTWTPWGTAQYAARFSRGVVFYSTSRHGGLKVTRCVGDRYLSEFARTHCVSTDGAYWFEEDGDINIALYELVLNLEGFRENARDVSKAVDDMESMKESVRRVYPDYVF